MARHVHEPSDLCRRGLSQQAASGPAGATGMPVREASPIRWPSTDGDVVRGVRQALVMLLFSAVLALVIAELGFALQGGEFRSKVAIAVMVIAGGVLFGPG